MLPLDVDLRSGLLDKEASELADCAHSIASLKNRIRVGERSVRRYAGLMVKYRGHAGMVGCVLAALGGRDGAAGAQDASAIPTVDDDLPHLLRSIPPTESIRRSFRSE